MEATERDAARIVRWKLFDRPAGPRPAELTPAGELLLAHARTVLAQLAVASDDLDSLLLAAV